MNQAVPAIPYVCPQCKTPVFWEQNSYTCRTCRVTYPVVFGIPDFRLNISGEQRRTEIAKIEQILGVYKEAGTFTDLMTRHVYAHTRASLAKHDLEYELGWEARGREVRKRIEYFTRRPTSDSRCLSDAYLDIGCGKGAALISLAPDFGQVVGVDYVLRYLVFAKILISEQNRQNIRLACASADRLPFPEGSFDLVTALDLIEHLPDQGEAVEEIVRCVKPAGELYLNSPNRLNVFTPEDHVRLWGVGLLPRRWMSTYVRCLGRGGYDGVRLLSIFELSQILKKHARQPFRVNGLMMMTARGGLKGVLRRFPILLRLVNTVFRWFIPSYNVIIRKAGTAVEGAKGPLNQQSASAH